MSVTAVMITMTRQVTKRQANIRTNTGVNTATVTMTTSSTGRWKYWNKYSTSQQRWRRSSNPRGPSSSCWWRSLTTTAKQQHTKWNKNRPLRNGSTRRCASRQLPRKRRCNTIKNKNKEVEASARARNGTRARTRNGGRTSHTASRSTTSSGWGPGTSTRRRPSRRTGSATTTSWWLNPNSKEAVVRTATDLMVI